MSEISRADAVIDVLLDQWPAIAQAIDRPAKIPVVVSEGWPGDAPGSDLIVIGDFTVDQAEKNLGARHRTETITIDVELLATRPGGTPTDVRRATADLSDALNTWARTTAGLTIAGSVCSARLVLVEFKHGITQVGRTGWRHCELIATFNRLT